MSLDPEAWIPQLYLVKSKGRGGRGRSGGGGQGQGAHFDPELLVEGAGDDAALKEHDGTLMRAMGHFKVQVVAPVPQLGSLQRLHMEVGPLDLWESGVGMRFPPEQLRGGLTSAVRNPLGLA